MSLVCLESGSQDPGSPRLNRCGGSNVTSVLWLADWLAAGWLGLGSGRMPPYCAALRKAISKQPPHDPTKAYVTRAPARTLPRFYITARSRTGKG